MQSVAPDDPRVLSNDPAPVWDAHPLPALRDIEQRSLALGVPFGLGVARRDPHDASRASFAQRGDHLVDLVREVPKRRRRVRSEDDDDVGRDAVARGDDPYRGPRAAADRSVDLGFPAALVEQFPDMTDLVGADKDGVPDQQDGPSARVRRWFRSIGVGSGRRGGRAARDERENQDEHSQSGHDLCVHDRRSPRAARGPSIHPFSRSGAPPGPAPSYRRRASRVKSIGWPGSAIHWATAPKSSTV